MTAFLGTRAVQVSIVNPAVTGRAVFGPLPRGSVVDHLSLISSASSASGGAAAAAVFRSRPPDTDAGFEGGSLLTGLQVPATFTRPGVLTGFPSLGNSFDFPFGVEIDEEYRFVGIRFEIIGLASLTGSVWLKLFMKGGGDAAGRLGAVEKARRKRGQRDEPPPTDDSFRGGLG